MESYSLLWLPEAGEMDDGLMFHFCANVLYGCSPFFRGCSGFLVCAVSARWLCAVTVHWKNVAEQELVLASQNSAITFKEFGSQERRWSLPWPADSWGGVAGRWCTAWSSPDYRTDPLSPTFLFNFVFVLTFHLMPVAFIFLYYK